MAQLFSEIRAIASVRILIGDSLQQKPWRPHFFNKNSQKLLKFGRGFQEIKEQTEHLKGVW